MNEASDPIQDLFRPLPGELRALIDRLEPAPPGSMGKMPPWAATLILHHSEGNIDVVDLPGLERPADPESGVIGTLEFEGVRIEFDAGGTAQALVATPRVGEGEWARDHLTDYWDTRVDAIGTACRRLASLAPSPRSEALFEIQHGVAEHVRALEDGALIQACVAIVDDLYKAAAGWTGYWGQEPHDYLTASAGTLSPLLVGRGIQVQYLIDNHWEDPIDAIELLKVWFGAAGFNFISPQDLARQIAMGEGAREDEEISRRAAEQIVEARREANEITAECQDLGGHLVIFDNDGASETWTQALRRCGEAGVITILRSAAPEPGTKVKAWLPER